VRKSELTQYGAGVVIYFQFLKFLMITYLTLTVLSVPAFIFYLSGNAQSFDKDTDIKSAITSLTLGNIGQGRLF
jgi:hypothetical protein